MIDHAINNNADLLKKANVVSIQAGTKIKNGKDTGEECVVVGVSEKKKVPDKDMIPGKVSGVITDVIEVLELYAL